MAKKRYYQSPKDRRHERRGMEREYMDEHRIKEARGEYYAGPKERRRQEMSDAGMLNEDHSAVANMPQEVIMRPYPYTSGYLPEDLDDTLRGVDDQMDYDNQHKMRHFYPKKV